MALSVGRAHTVHQDGIGYEAAALVASRGGWSPSSGAGDALLFGHLDAGARRELPRWLVQDIEESYQRLLQPCFTGEGVGSYC